MPLYETNEESSRPPSGKGNPSRSPRKRAGNADRDLIIFSEIAPAFEAAKEAGLLPDNPAFVRVFCSEPVHLLYGEKPRRGVTYLSGRGEEVEVEVIEGGYRFTVYPLGKNLPPKVYEVIPK